MAKPTVGRVVHYYTVTGEGPWMAWVVRVDLDGCPELYVVPPQKDGPPHHAYPKREHLPEEAEAQRNNGISFWCWPPRV